MKSRLSILIVLACLPCMLFGQKTPSPKTGKPTIAVFDAAIPKGFDSAAVIPITDSLSEELVNSGKYTVLDRAHIQVALQEKAFKMSELVNDSEAKSAGEMLGAEYVVVIRVQDFDGTLFLSAKMINVTTGEIQAQASSNVESRKLAKLIELAHNAGIKLAGGVKETQTGPSLATPPKTMPQPARETPQKTVSSPENRPANTEQKPPYSHLIVGALAPAITLDGILMDGTSSGFQVQWMQHLFFGIYAGAEFSSVTSSFGAVNLTTYVSYDMEVTGSEFNGMLGYVLPLGDYLQLYAAFKGGVLACNFSGGGQYNQDFTPAMGGLEFGAEFSLFRVIPLVIEFDLSASPENLVEGVNDWGPLSWSSFMLGIGFSY